MIKQKKHVLAKTKLVSQERIYDIILKPLVTEKATMMSENNAQVFHVLNDATKPEIKEAIQKLFKVKVKTVNTLNVKGKQKRFRGKIGFRSDYKKAMVTLEAGQNIDLAAGA